MASIFDRVNAVVWGAPALILMIGVGIYLTIRTGFAQITLFSRAFRDFLASFRRGKSCRGAESPFRALCTALAATVGTGNLVGVAGAICLGGPGSVFWLWVCGFLGMATKFAEATLAVRFRVKKEGGYVGGPMYMICRGMGKAWQPLAVVYSLFGIVASFGVGNATQVNAFVSGVNTVLGRFGWGNTRTGNLLMGIALALLVGAVLLGGAKRIGAASEVLVCGAAAAYILFALGVLVLRAPAIPGAFRAILQGAWDPRAVTGGALGSAFQAMRIGCSRGVFTNEAGMGTASLAHGSAQVDHPVRQGLMGIMEVFLDTIVICTLTALVILCSGIAIPYGTDGGAELTTGAFRGVYGIWADVGIAAALCSFAFATILGWGLYGARCGEYLFGKGCWKWFALAQTGAVVLGAVADTGVVWSFAEAINGLMAIPNLIALAALSGELSRLTIEFKRKSGSSEPVEEAYADFHQCKPVRALSHAEIPPSGCGGKEAGKAHLSSEYRSA